MSENTRSRRAIEDSLSRGDAEQSRLLFTEAVAAGHRWDDADLLALLVEALNRGGDGVRLWLARRAKDEPTLDPKLGGFATALAVSLKEKEPDRFRAAVERFVQGIRDLKASFLSKTFSALEARNFPDVTAKYDYSTSSYMLWQTGLQQTAEGRYSEAIDALRLSVTRYEAAGLAGDMLWSSFDVVTAYVLAHRVDEADSYYEDRLRRAAPSRFQDMAHLVLRAAKTGDTAALDAVEELLQRTYGTEFYDSWYPRILRALRMRDGTVRGSPSSHDPRPPQRPRIEPAVSAGPAKDEYVILISKPVDEDPETVERLIAIAGQVNLGNSRPSYIRQQVKASRLFFADKTSWRHGLAFFCTHLFAADSTPRGIIGSAKVQYLFDARWVRETVTRIAHKQFPVSTDVVRFSASRSNALEMAGNGVLPQFRHTPGLSVGKFQCQARILFVLQVGIRPYTRLVMNLLTTKDDDGTYPFYEYVVRPLFGEPPGQQDGPGDGTNATQRHITYDEADEIRYKDIEYLTHLLGAVDSAPVEFPLHVLPMDIQGNFGTVKEDTKRIQAIWKRYGFAELNEYDLLDSGQYMGVAMKALPRACQPYLLHRKARFLEASEPGTGYYTFAPIVRRRSGYWAARTMSQLDETSIAIPRGMRGICGVNEGDEVLVLLDHLQGT